MCLWSAWEGAAASGLDSPEQGELIQRNYVIFDIAKQEGSPILKRSGKIGELPLLLALLKKKSP